MKKSFWVILGLAALFAYGCGSGGSNTSNPNSSGDASGEGATIATSVAGGTTSASTNGTTSGDDGVTLSLNKKVTSHVIKKMQSQPWYKNAPTIIKTPTYNQGCSIPGTCILTFSNEQFSEGGGTITLDGDLTVTLSVSSQTLPTTITIDMSGDLDVTFDNVTETVTVDEVDYTETISGTQTITYDGCLSMYLDSNGDSSSTIDMTATATGSNITISGDVNGTVDSMNVTIDISGTATDTETNITTTCDGSVTVTTTEQGTETCNIDSTCTGCE